MNNNLRKIIILFFTFLFVIFLLNIIIKGFKTNQTEITNMNILNYIPEDYEFTIISNSKSSDIKKYINENISEKKREEFKIAREGLISYLGFDLQNKIEDIYDDEFALTFIGNKKKSDILLIFKIKKNKNIDQIIKIGKELSQSDQITELNSTNKLHYLSHIIKTKDNYILASSNKNLINRSLKSNNNSNINLYKKIIPDEINLKEIKLLSISKNFYPGINSNSKLESMNKIISIAYSKANKIKLKSFSSNINKLYIKSPYNNIENIKNIISTNKYSKYKKNIDFLYDNINQKEFLKEITQKINDKILFITNNNNWVFYFNSKFPSNISIDEFKIFKKYKREDFYINNMTYSIYTNDTLKMKDSYITYNKGIPIFSIKDDEKVYISNDFDTLLNIKNKASIADQYINSNSEIKSYKYIINDVFFIKNINNNELSKYFKYFKNLQYFLNNELFSLEDININIKHVIPENNEMVYFESNFKIL